MAQAKDVLAYILEKKFTTGKLQRQKILYYAQAWSLVWTGRPLFDSRIEAWEKGPVVVELWTRGSDEALAGSSDNLTSDEMAIIDSVYSTYGRKNGARLMDLTHSETPWCEATKNAEIDRGEMMRCYSKQAMSVDVVTPERPAIGRLADMASFRRADEASAVRWHEVNSRLAAL